MDQVRERSGRVDVLLHAAGVEISRNLPEKEPREFDLVFDVKTTGWFNVWQAARTMEVGAVVAFSSVAGRFGNNGQTDYAAANDLLCKVVSSMRATRPADPGLALDWTAWGGIGMATRGSIPKIMEMAGVQVLPPEAGVAWIRRELTSSAFSGEVVVAGALGMMAGEYHESGGVDADALPRDGTRSARWSVTSPSRCTTGSSPGSPSTRPSRASSVTTGSTAPPSSRGSWAWRPSPRSPGWWRPPGYRVGGVEDVGLPRAREVLPRRAADPHRLGRDGTRPRGR